MKDYISKHLEYKDGDLYWKEPPSNRVKKNSLAGYLGKDGYRRINIQGIPRLTHRLVFLLHRGYAPKCIDHINGNPLDNRIENLREVSLKGNALNLKGPHKDNQTGYLGVSFHKQHGLYLARFKGESLGWFKTAEEASKTYWEKKSPELEKLDAGTY